ncbi:PIR Superfamily Protein [Plasmodium malariae]|uniref:PIR Superfamily Protein n=1 Tax=Plasmodium malariae TaxID=5858 RepID=A0A1A8X6U2_PLAMA|nr:PIR Superfamily Protein [Plasmodium malariae]
MSITLLASMTLFFLYKFTPAKSWLYSRLQKRKIIEPNEISEETPGFLQNTYEKVNRTYEGSFNNLTNHPQRYS